ncbi:hypothetical protein [Pseudomonas aeruginosa]|uniref:hypothetical protein n=1 Tax=Pseudomonas aeruginosa TaxID=287 RepID=UPI0010431EAA|nr:hypothetical protein [Pseudomonas aeruginosa]HCE6897248.1 hypothetical protein [Pseudomonas aeruginosa]HCE6902988.1 hypothetical protein [Pseudomonas aeruginosa]HCE7019909.1 hypothetical protein [Pseudomonas aeruginosa]HCE7064492.1 hypothetical protein [Pseudomonas aeruginosa]HCE7347594.1 hypothetical protein [Pseudomonas aeruginosa]
MTRMQARRNTDFTGWPSTEGQTGSQHALEGKTMKTVVFSDTLKKLSVGQKVYAQGGGHGVVSEIRENCSFPVFLILNSGRIAAFTAAEIFPA